MSECLIRRKNLFAAAVLFAALLAILTLYPLRLYKEDHLFSTGHESYDVSERVDYQHDAGVAFTAEYAHLKEITFHIAALDKSGAIECRLYDLKSDPAQPKCLATEHATLLQSMVPGYLTVPMDVDLVPGQEYTFMIYGNTAWFYVDYVDPWDMTEETQNPHIVRTIHYDSTVDGFALMSDFVYRMPIGKGPTMKRIAAIGLAALLAAAALIFAGKKNRFLNGEVTLRRGLAIVFTPAVLAACASLLYLIIVKKLFDQRLTDIALYAAGTVLAAGLALYSLWKKKIVLPGEGAHDGARKEAESTLVSAAATFLKKNGRHILISAAITVAFAYACEYMNGLYDIFHMMSQRKMILALLIMLLFTFSAKRLFVPTNLIWVLVSGIGAVVYYRAHAAGPDVKEYAEKNTVLLSLLLIVLFAGWVILATLQEYLASGKRVRLSRSYVALTALVAAALVIFRYTRWWPVTMAALYLLIFFRITHWEEQDRWLRDVGRGIMFHFFYMVAYCLLHRLYMAFIFTRFPLDFHTVTVTAVYLTAVICAAVSMLLTKLLVAERAGLKGLARINFAWKECVFFGIAASYLVMTMSRTGVLAVFAVAAVLCLFCGFAGDKEAALRKGVVRILSFAGAMLLSLILLFIPVFTMQRIIPALVSEPKVFEIEMPDYHEEVLRGDRYDSPFYMCAERFVPFFGVKFLGLPEQEYDFYHTWDWLETGEAPPEGSVIATDLSADMAAETDEGFMDFKAQAEEEAAMRDPDYWEDEGDEEEDEEVETEEEPETEGDYSNGRREIFARYMEEIGLKGHSVMGVEAENGEMLVHAHNIYLQTAYDHGLPVGLLFVLFVLLTMLRAGIYYKKNQEPARAAHGEEGLSCLPLAAATGFAVTGVVEWVFHLCNPMSLLFLLCLAPLLERDGAA